MATITATFSTDDKSLAVAIDGKAVENVRCIHAHPSYERDDEYCFCVETTSADTDSGIQTYTRLMAAVLPDGDKAAKAGALPSTSFPGFVEEKVEAKTKAVSDIEAFFGK